MNGKALRRLAADHAALHSQELPPNYFFPASSSHTDDLTHVDILLAGPTHTPFVKGVWKLHLSIPPQYPQQPPTANFRTPIFHPNVDPQTGGVCVETLKRDWDSKLTLRDVLVTISCLLIQPNPDSALNADAGALIQENYDTFAKRAEIMTGIHAVIPKTLTAAVQDAQHRGQVLQTEEEDSTAAPEAPVRRRRTIARVRAARRGDASPTGAPSRRQQRPQPGQPFGIQADSDDVFGVSAAPRPTRPVAQADEDEDGMEEEEQENDSIQSPPKAPTPKAARTPRRPHGVAVPLGELIIEQEEEDSDDEMQPEYPPSPRKSPSKSPPKRRHAQIYDFNSTFDRPEGSRDAALRAPNITPPNFNDQPLAEDSPFMMDVTFEGSVSPKKAQRRLFETPPKRAGKMGLFGDMSNVTSERKHVRSMLKQRSPSSVERKRAAEQARAELNSRLWRLCGGDIRRWNRGDFDGEPYKKKAGRW